MMRFSVLCDFKVSKLKSLDLFLALLAVAISNRVTRIWFLLKLLMQDSKINVELK